MIVNRYNLFIKIVKNRTKRFYIRFGSWYISPQTIIPSPYNDPVVVDQTGTALVTVTPPQATWIPTDITNWRFTFTVNFPGAPEAINFDPIINEGDSTSGILLWNLLPIYTMLLTPKNGTFSMSVTQADLNPDFFCGGVVSLVDI